MVSFEKVLFLRNVSLFETMPSRQLVRLAAIAEEVVFPTGSSIFDEGDYGSTMFLIVDGKVKIHRSDRVLATLGESAYFGEMSLLDGEPRSASVVAVTDCLLLRIKQDEFQEILSSHFEAALAVIKTLTEHLRKIEKDRMVQAPKAGAS